MSDYEFRTIDYFDEDGEWVETRFSEYILPGGKFGRRTIVPILGREDTPEMLAQARRIVERAK